MSNPDLYSNIICQHLQCLFKYMMTTRVTPATIKQQPKSLHRHPPVIIAIISGSHCQRQANTSPDTMRESINIHTDAQIMYNACTAKHPFPFVQAVLSCRRWVLTAIFSLHREWRKPPREISTCASRVWFFACRFTKSCRPVLTTFAAMAYKRQRSVITL